MGPPVSYYYSYMIKNKQGVVVRAVDKGEKSIYRVKAALWLVNDRCEFSLIFNG